VFCAEGFQDVWRERIVGACMVYYDLTMSPRLRGPKMVPVPRCRGLTGPAAAVEQDPVYRANRLVLIEVQDTLRLESNDHYTWIVTARALSQ